MAIVQAGKIKLFYEEGGSGKNGAVILIRGQGTQLIHWPASFYEPFAAQGYRTVRFDNRDTGLSQKFDHVGDRELEALRRQVAAGKQFRPPYTLDDMVLDVVHLMDALSIAKAHIVGISMGGFITQVLAARHPERVSTMTSIMSASGGADPQIVDLLWSQRVSREAFVEAWVDYIRTFGSPGYAAGDEHSRQTAAAAYDRCYSPDGANRQILAILSAGDIDLPALVKTIRVPALVIHGAEDGLIAPQRGEETADLIPGAAFRLVEGMGHDTPPALGPHLAEIVLEHIRAVESS